MCFGKANGDETVTTINHSFKKSSNAWGRGGGGICNLKTNEEVADPAYSLCNLERTLQNLHIKIEKSTCALIFFFQSLFLFLTKIQVAIYVEEVCIIAVHLATFSL